MQRLKRHVELPPDLRGAVQAARGLGLVGFEMVQIPKATEHLGFEEPVIQVARNRKAVLEQTPRLVPRVTVQVQFPQ